MPTMISEVYEALVEAGASREKASNAAEAVASFHHRLARIEADLLLLKWMVGTILALAGFLLVVRLIAA